MSYASLDNLKDRYGERMLIGLTDRGDVALGVIDTDAVDRALADTDALIDGYLVARYALPITTTPAILTDLAQSIAIYKLHVGATDPKIERDHDNAIRTLKDISTGAIRLSIAGAEPSGTGASGARITDRERPLTAENMKGFI